MLTCGRTVIFLLLLAKVSITVVASLSNSSDHSVVDESHDPYKEICTLHSGEYYRETSMKLVCCGNDSLKLPEVLIHDKSRNEIYSECSEKFHKDDTSDFPTGMWRAFLCKLKKSKVFKNDKITFEELMNFITKFYPASIKTKLKQHAEKCNAIDSENVDDQIKVQKYMECYYEAENITCHKPYGGAESHEEDIKKTKELGCPVVPGLMFASSIEYCCKKRSTPYPILEFPGWEISEKTWHAISDCRESFARKEIELMPEASKASTTPETNDGDDYQMSTTWDSMCFSACAVEQKNYTESMLKLDPDRLIKFFTQDFGSTMKNELSAIIKRRKNKEKIFLAMGTDSKSSKPMNFAELSEKFSHVSEREKIQYFCKFVETIAFEERRALHEYCFDEKYGNEWGDMHHSILVPQH